MYIQWKRNPFHPANQTVLTDTKLKKGIYGKELFIVTRDVDVDVTLTCDIYGNVE